MARSDRHYMVDSRVIGRIVERAGLTDDDVVLEVGAGHGELTEILSGAAGRVVAFEIDMAASENLRRRFAGTNVEIICADVTKMELPVFTKCVSNLPYSISSAFTLRLTELEFELAVLTYQMEFAHRLLAVPGNKGYSPVSVLAGYSFDVKIEERVPRTAFRPRPSVESAVLMLKPRLPPYKLEHPEFFRRFLAAAFSHRRKKMKGSLTACELSGERLQERHLLGIPNELLEQRAEELPPERLAGISDALYHNLQ
jgi:16S rRNA (adenine1518-N6/adenine1519-N6)-dimethyltransferase